MNSRQANERTNERANILVRTREFRFWGSIYRIATYQPFDCQRFISQHEKETK